MRWNGSVLRLHARRLLCLPSIKPPALAVLHRPQGGDRRAKRWRDRATPAIRSPHPGQGDSDCDSEGGPGEIGKRNGGGVMSWPAVKHAREARERIRNPVELAVLDCLAWRCNPHKHRFQSQCTQQDFERETGYSWNAVKRAWRRLVASGEIAIAEKGGKRGGRCYSYIFLLKRHEQETLAAESAKVSTAGKEGVQSERGRCAEETPCINSKQLAVSGSCQQQGEEKIPSLPSSSEPRRFAAGKKSPSEKDLRIRMIAALHPEDDDAWYLSLRAQPEFADLPQDQIDRSRRRFEETSGGLTREGFLRWLWREHRPVKLSTKVKSPPPKGSHGFEEDMQMGRSLHTQP